MAPLFFALCADDYAMTPGVTRGILEALDAGALSATSVITNSPWWPESAAALLPYVGRADIGLHLNLTLGAPLGPMPHLAPDGRLPSLSTLMRAARGKRFPAEEVAEEIDRQCEAFVTVFGRPPDHIDGHQHIQMLSAIRPTMFQALERRRWRPWLRDSTDRLHRLLRRSGRKKALALCILGDGFGRHAARLGLPTNAGFAGFSAFDAAKPLAPSFETYLRAPGPRHLVMCHPGYVDQELRRLDPVVETREIELKYIISELPNFLEKAKAKLARMSDICRTDFL